MLVAVVLSYSQHCMYRLSLLYTTHILQTCMFTVHKIPSYTNTHQHIDKHMLISSYARTDSMAFHPSHIQRPNFKFTWQQLHPWC